MLNLFTIIETEQEDVNHVISELTSYCDSCRLSLLHPKNSGFLFRGNPLSSMAVIYMAPRDAETERGVALIGGQGRLFERWCSFLKLDSKKDMFILPVIHCQPEKVPDKQGDTVQREPDKTEISSCFGPKTLRVLRAMPNLEVIMLVGWNVCDVFLGVENGKSGYKANGGQWFETSLLPGIPVFCMQDLLWQTNPASETKDAVIENWLTYFGREYLELDMIKPLAKQAQQKREEQGRGLL